MLGTFALPQLHNVLSDRYQSDALPASLIKGNGLRERISPRETQGVRAGIQLQSAQRRSCRLGPLAKSSLHVCFPCPSQCFLKAGNFTRKYKYLNSLEKLDDLIILDEFLEGGN